MSNDEMHESSVCRSGLYPKSAGRSRDENGDAGLSKGLRQEGRSRKEDLPGEVPEACMEEVVSAKSHNCPSLN